MLAHMPLELLVKNHAINDGDGNGTMFMLLLSPPLILFSIFTVLKMHKSCIYTVNEKGAL